MGRANLVKKKLEADRSTKLMSEGGRDEDSKILGGTSYSIDDNTFDSTDISYRRRVNHLEQLLETVIQRINVVDQRRIDDFTEQTVYNEQVNQRLRELDQKILKVEQKLSNFSEAMLKIDQKILNVQEAMSKIDQKWSSLSKSVSNLSESITIAFENSKKTNDEILVIKETLLKMTEDSRQFESSLNDHIKNDSNVSIERATIADREIKKLADHQMSSEILLETLKREISCNSQTLSQHVKQYDALRRDLSIQSQQYKQLPQMSTINNIEESIKRQADEIASLRDLASDGKVRASYHKLRAGITFPFDPILSRPTRHP